MKLVTFLSGHGEALGALLPEGDILDLALARQMTGDVGIRLDSMMDIIAAGDNGLELAQRLLDVRPDEAVVPIASARLRSPIRPPRLRDTLMFLQHMENGLDKWARNLANEEDDPEAAYARLKASGKYSLHPVFKQQVIYYNADHLAISGHGDVIHWPPISDYVDFELEWACVIGRPVRGIKASDARSAIFGYTVYNDWSARDIQLDFQQANLGPSGGKDFSGSNTLGPCIVTADEIADPYALRMTATVNGELRSDGNTSTMHHRFEQAIEQFSRFETLSVGEVIGSGTVLNGCGYELGRKLKDGDVVSLEVEGIGVLTNRVSLPG